MSEQTATTATTSATTPLEIRRVGILGGGQLGQMLSEAGARLGLQVSVLDPTADCPASVVAFKTHLGSFRDAAAIRELARNSDVVTVEIEHVDADTLQELVETSNPPIDVQPAPATIRLLQDKYQQKLHLASKGCVLGRFQAITGPEDLHRVASEWGYPYVLKSRRMAYDGRGNYTVRSAEEIPTALERLGGFGTGGERLYAEAFVPFVKELAVMVVRSKTGEVRAYPVVETVHQNHICHTVEAPAPIPAAAQETAQRIAKQAIATLDGAGIFGVELFLCSDESVLINEIAPRPHNSGHYTLQACATSQFEQHLRAILGWPLGDTGLSVGAAVMYNVLGRGTSMQETKASMCTALSVPGSAVYWYNKKSVQPGRKMGHINFVAGSRAELLERIKPMAEWFTLPEAFAAAQPLVGVIMGSDSDLPVMRVAGEILTDFGVPFELTIVSAHRTPVRMVEYAQQAAGRGLKVIIAGAGGAAHLPGMVAALTPLPVVGVPVRGSAFDGLDSLLSIVQMPRGVPVATVAVNNATNAALLAIRILSVAQPHLLQKMHQYQAQMDSEVHAKVDKMDQIGWQNYVHTK